MVESYFEWKVCGRYTIFQTQQIKASLATHHRSQRSDSSAPQSRDGVGVRFSTLCTQMALTPAVRALPSRVLGSQAHHLTQTHFLLLLQRLFL